MTRTPDISMSDAERQQYDERVAIVLEGDIGATEETAMHIAISGILEARRLKKSRMSGREQARALARSLKANGFTLVELLLVMLALFCLGTVAIIAYARALGCTP